MTGEFKEVLVTLEVNLSLVYHFERVVGAPRLPPSPQLGGGPPPVAPPSARLGLPAMPLPLLPPSLPPPPVFPPLLPPSPSPRTPRSPPAFPIVGKENGAQPASAVGSVGVAAVLPAVALVLGILCCCRFGRRSQRALESALRPKQLIEPVIELPQFDGVK